MRLFSRIFIGHLGVILIACTAIVVTTGLVSPGFYRRNLNQIVLLKTPEWAWLRVTLEEGHKRTVLLSLALSLPLAISLAVGTAYLETRRIAAAVRRLAEGSREIASGHYGERLEVRGKDELAELALHFNEMAEALERADRDRIALVAAVAHELKTPLAALQGYAEAVSDGVMASSGATHAIVREVAALRRIADDLLLVARVEAGALRLQPGVYEPGQLLGEVQDRFTHAFEARDISFGLELSGDLPRVRVDRQRLAQVLGNLLSNALRHTPKGGHVALGAKPAEGEVVFFVADDGPGIPSKDQQRIFERFYRIDRERGDGGIGIGLTVARGLTQAMGGRIWLESELGRGSTFYFTVPAAA